MALSILSDPPEIAHLPWRERERLLGAARRRVSATGAYGRGLFLGFTLCLMIVQLALSLLNAYVREASQPYQLFNIGLGVATLLLMVVLMAREVRIGRRAFAAVLIEHGIRPRRCPSCGSEPTPGSGATCPRCNTPLVLPRSPTSDQPATAGAGG